MTQDTPKKKVLIVEDDRDMRELICMTLGEETYTYIEAQNGREGMDKITQNPDISIMLVDYKMPVMNGLAFLTRIRKQDILPTVPVVVVSGFADHGFMQTVANLNVHKVFHKPFDIDVFTDTVDQLL